MKRNAWIFWILWILGWINGATAVATNGNGVVGFCGVMAFGFVASAVLYAAAASVAK